MAYDYPAVTNSVFGYRDHIPFPLELLADQVIYFLQVNNPPIYKAFNKLPSAGRRQLLNDITAELIHIAIGRMRAVIKQEQEPEDEWPLTP